MVRVPPDDGPAGLSRGATSRRDCDAMQAMGRHCAHHTVSARLTPYEVHMLVPFGKSRRKAGYTGASGPNSKGRMPKRGANGAPPVSKVPTRETIDVEHVDGGRRGHDYGGSNPVGAYSRKLFQDV